MNNESAFTAPLAPPSPAVSSRGTKIAYWVSTGLFSAMMALSAVMYLTQPMMAAAFQHLGFPAYFRVELGIAKLVGVVALLAPPVPARVKEWAYAGFGITLLSAIVAHFVVDGPSKVVGPIIGLLLLAVSYTMREKMSAASSVTAA